MRLLPAIGLIAGLAACSDPLAGVGRLGDVDIAAGDPAAAALPDAQEIAREGFLGTSAASGDVPEGLPDPVEASAARGGFFGNLIRRAANADPAAAVAAQVAESQSSAASVDAASAEIAALAPGAGQRRSGGGLFGARAAPQEAARTGPDARDVSFGTELPFGEIARVCDAKGQPLGKRVASLGRRGFALYDSNPGIVNKRAFYITGFSDDCPRQFTAANALFGAPSFYETIRYSPAGAHLPYAATDEAYDKVKSSVCRAGKDAPCGNQIGKLDTSLAFVSAYEFHEHNNAWKEFLIYEGTVLAGAQKAY